MEEARPKYACPSCNRAVLNRKVDRCLYCGATLPAELLFTPEQIEQLNEQQREVEAKGDRFKPSHGGGDLDVDWDIGGGD